MGFRSFILVGAALVIMTPTAMASPPDVTFLCENMPEVCTNMCWAVRCANPTFPQVLTWDNPGPNTKKARRASAGCVLGNNKCNKNHLKDPLHRNGTDSSGDPYNSCDEYPFASTSQSTYPNGHQVSRCVPNAQNSAQGRALQNQAYAKWKKAGFKTHSLKINFGNPGSTGVNYCLSQPCTNDGFEIQNGAVTKRDAPNFLFYKTSAGITIASMDPNEIGSNFTRQVGEDEDIPTGHVTWWDEELEDQLVVDVVMEEITADAVVLGQ